MSDMYFNNGNLEVSVVATAALVSRVAGSGLAAHLWSSSWMSVSLRPPVPCTAWRVVVGVCCEREAGARAILVGFLEEENKWPSPGRQVGRPHEGGEASRHSRPWWSVAGRVRSSEEMRGDCCRVHGGFVVDTTVRTLSSAPCKVLGGLLMGQVCFSKTPLAAVGGQGLSGQPARATALVGARQARKGGKWTRDIL